MEQKRPRIGWTGPCALWPPPKELLARASSCSLLQWSSAAPALLLLLGVRACVKKPHGPYVHPNLPLKCPCGWRSKWETMVDGMEWRTHGAAGEEACRGGGRQGREEEEGEKRVAEGLWDGWMNAASDCDVSCILPCPTPNPPHPPTHYTGSHALLLCLPLPSPPRLFGRPGVCLPPAPPASILLLLLPASSKLPSSSGARDRRGATRTRPHAQSHTVREKQTEKDGSRRMCSLRVLHDLHVHRRRPGIRSAGVAGGRSAGHT